jgi:hypothetical protein
MYVMTTIGRIGGALALLTAVSAARAVGLKVSRQARLQRPTQIQGDDILVDVDGDLSVR